MTVAGLAARPPAEPAAWKPRTSQGVVTAIESRSREGARVVWYLVCEHARDGRAPGRVRQRKPSRAKEACRHVLPVRPGQKPTCRALCG